MNLEQLILGKIAEEASEIAKAALKAQQFGLDDCDPSSTELDELKAALGVLSQDLSDSTDGLAAAVATPGNDEPTPAP